MQAMARLHGEPSSRSSVPQKSKVHDEKRRMAAMAQSTQEKLEGMADKASEQFRHYAGRAEEAAGRVADRGREAGERVQDVAGNFKGAVDKSIREQPMATLALAAVAGFLLGALWKR
jgi:ElaB/YqjD/DUF883 family membrane-anchored ribosome-binding protein